MRLYDTARGEVVPFEPGPLVTLYSCGITPYDAAHLGHAAVYLYFDLLQRRLRDAGHETRCVRNVTDVDDDILRKARELGVHYLDLAAEEMARFDAEMGMLNLLPVYSEPRATSAISEILSLIGAALDAGHAYESGGSVYFDVASFPRFGRVSGFGRSEMLRLAAEHGGNPDDPHKRNPLDFVLWQPSLPDEPAWESRWGPGRPGWHIECSAMSTSLLGPYFDLHGGGEDLKFPHHENEIAQSCAACDTPFVKVWMHNGFVRVNDEKMSKSLGNFFTVREVLKTLRDPEVMRFFLLSSHYRGPINYSQAQLAQADETLLGLYRALKDSGAPRTADLAAAAQGAAARAEVDSAAMRRFTAAMDDDFNTPEALAVLQGVARDLNSAKAAGNAADAAAAAATLRSLGQVLGVLQQDPDAYLKRSVNADGMTDTEIESLLAARQAARSARNFAESDRIRDRLSAAGILLEDRVGGPTQWRRA